MLVIQHRGADFLSLCSDRGRQQAHARHAAGARPPRAGRGRVLRRPGSGGLPGGATQPCPAPFRSLPAEVSKVPGIIPTPGLCNARKMFLKVFQKEKENHTGLLLPEPTALAVSSTATGLRRAALWKRAQTRAVAQAPPEVTGEPRSTAEVGRPQSVCASVWSGLRKHPSPPQPPSALPAAHPELWPAGRRGLKGVRASCWGAARVPLGKARARGTEALLGQGEAGKKSGAPRAGLKPPVTHQTCNHTKPSLASRVLSHVFKNIFLLPFPGQHPLWMPGSQGSGTPAQTHLRLSGPGPDIQAWEGPP